MDNQEYFESPEKKKNSGFGKGLAAGVIGTLLVVTLIAGNIWLFVLPGINRKNQENNQADGSSRDVIFGEEVEEKAGQIADIIDKYYYDEIDRNAMVEGMYTGMVDGLGDRYSSYFSAETYASYNDSTTGVYYGIGAVLNQNLKTGIVTILHVYPGTPAEETGVRDGDIIVKVGDIEGDSMELSELVTHIKGEEGSTVHLELMRAGESEHIQVDVVRRQIEVPTVEYQMLEGQVGFIQVSEFTESTHEQFLAAIKELQGQGMKSMIVDLRNNPGGILQTVCAMLDEILPEGLVVYTEDKYGHRSDYKSDASCLELPLAVLINENSASASEIFAGAIKDYEYGTLIGTTTFGKGIVQTIVPLEDGSAVKVTMAKYFTPKGNYIHDVGIQPDIELEYEYQSQDDETYNPMHDNQVLKALETLQNND